MTENLRHNPDVPRNQGDGFDQRMINEIRILIDYLSGASNRGLASGTAGRLPTKITNGQGSPTTYTYSEALEQFFKIIDSQQVSLKAPERHFLSEFRDYLAEAAKPASATTIAFSTLVSQYERSGKKASGDALFTSMGQAFPDFDKLAWKFRRRITSFRRGGLACLFAILLAGMYAYWGNLYLAGLTQSHAQEAGIRDKLAVLEGQISAAQEEVERRAGGDLTLPRLTGCVLYTRAIDDTTSRHYSSNAMADILEGADPARVDAPDLEFLSIAKGQYNNYCSQWLVAKGDIESQQSRLGDVVNVGMDTAFFVPRVMVSWFGRFFPSATASEFDRGPSKAKNPAVELSGAAAVAIVNGYVLTLFMGALGSIVFVLRTYLVQLQDKTLHPRDRHVYSTRLVLGIILGLAIGFFLQPAAPKTAAPDQFNVVISLATPALAFLAGYAVEVVFGLLDSLAQILFQARKQA